MQPIALARVTWALAYVDVLRRIGAPVERELRRVRLPTLLDEWADAYVPAAPVLSFVESIARAEGIDDLGLLATERGTFGRLGGDLLATIRSAPTLAARVRRLGEFAAAENSHLLLSIVPEGPRARVCLSLDGLPELTGAQYAEWLQLDVLIGMIRDAVGPRWQPLEITFRSRFALPAAAMDRYPEARFVLGAAHTSITLPAPLLGEFFPSTASPTTSDAAASPIVLGSLVEQPGFPGVLKRALRPYLADEPPDVRVAAEIAGVSARTLQRRLLEAGLTYRGLLRELRVEAAAEILARPEATVLDAAYAVGYTDPSNFARAFRGVTGAGPRRHLAAAGRRTR